MRVLTELIQKNNSDQGRKMLIEATPSAMKTGSITIRLLGRQDTWRLDALHQRLSPETIYQRYFSPRKPPQEELERVCRLNEAGGGALAAVHDDTIVGVAYYITADGQTAEPAILVEDRFQRQGIGGRLANALGRLALARGLDTFSMLILSDNQAVLQLIRRSGMPVETGYSQGLREVRISLSDERATTRTSKGWEIGQEVRDALKIVSGRVRSAYQRLAV